MCARGAWGGDALLLNQVNTVNQGAVGLRLTASTTRPVMFQYTTVEKALKEVDEITKPLDGVLEILQCRNPSCPNVTHHTTQLLNEAVDRIRESKKAAQLQNTMIAIERLLQDLSTAGDITEVHDRNVSNYGESLA